MQPSSGTAAHVRPDEIYMFTGNAAELRGVPHALLLRELVSIENSVRMDP